MAVTVFSEFSRLALEHGAINLGQGFPDFEGPEAIKLAAIEAILHGSNQYAATQGVPVLRQAIVAHSERFYQQRGVDVAVTSGATEALFDAVLAFVKPGDEVVLFEPYYDSYLAAVLLAGGVPRYVRLQAPDTTHATWWFDERELAAAFTDKTRLVMLNTPHNPTGKVFSRDELLLIGGMAKRQGAVVVSDEVYEHIVFAPARHVRLATLPGMHDHTLTISSSGKSFSLTGWKIGWAIGPRALVDALQAVHQWVTFASAAPLQHGIAAALALDDGYFATLVHDYTRKRDLLSAGLRGAGFAPFAVEGSYFIIADTRARYASGDDVDCCR